MNYRALDMLAVAVLLSLCSEAAAAAPARQRPLLQMEQAAIALAENASDVAVGVRLVGSAQAPVIANVTALLLPVNNATVLDEGLTLELEALLEPSSLSWGPGKTGVRFVQLRSVLELLLGEEGMLNEEGLQQQQLVVQLMAASNAEIAEQQSSTKVLLQFEGWDTSNSWLAPEDVPLFGFLPNQVAYPPQQQLNSSSAPSIPVHLLSGQLAEPATLLWQLQLLTLAAEQFLPLAAMQGVLRFEANNSSSPVGLGADGQQMAEQRVTVPVEWQHVPPEAEYRLGLQLYSFYNARVADQQSQVALHIFGTANGTCPPGTALRSQPAAPAGAGPISSLGSLVQPGAQQGVVDLILSINGSVMDLSSAFQPTVHEYGAQVEEDITDVTLCLRRSQANSSILVAGRSPATIVDAAAAPDDLTIVSTSSSAAAARFALPPVLEDVDALCNCDPALLGEADLSDLDLQREEDASSGSSCGYSAWQLPLTAGQNQFNITLQEPKANGSVSVQRYSLAVVRQSPAEHAYLAGLTLKAFNGTTVALCGISSTGDGSSDMPAQLLSLKRERGSNLLPGRTGDPPHCEPDVLLAVNVSESTQMVSLSPLLLHPEVPGVRVEINGRVLARGGDLTADRLADTAGQLLQQQSVGTNTSDGSNNSSSIALPLSSLLPSAFILGMQPGMSMDVAVVVVAEDGVTSARYPVSITRLPAMPKHSGTGSSLARNEHSGSSNTASVTAVAAGAEAVGVPAASLAYDKQAQQAKQLSSAELQQRGWPVPPALQPNCSPCPAGWAAAGINASQCIMCPPGSASAAPQSTACQPCRPGTYAFSWGSTHCKHCIVQTYAPSEGSALCKLCPANWTNLDDGQASCSLPLDAAASNAAWSQRYAVVVSFSVFLNGVDAEDVILQAGVNASPEAIVSSLVAADTASAFNITPQAVHVLGVAQVARRTLAANISATLGVDLPVGASEEAIAAAMEVQRLSADAPIQMLSSDPDRFFGRTTKTLDVTVESFGAATVESRPRDDRAGPNKWALIVPGMAGVIAGSVLVGMGLKRSRKCMQWRRSAGEWVSTTPLAPRSMRYTRYDP